MIPRALLAFVLLVAPLGWALAASAALLDEETAAAEVSSPIASQTTRVRRRLLVPHATVPTLTTTEVYGITAFWAFTGGTVTSDGGAAVTSRGVCWSTSSDPTIADSTTIDGDGSGTYISCIPGLQAGTTYTIRAYATNAVATGYGGAVTFSTPTPNPQLEYFGQTPPGRQFVRFARTTVPEDMYHSVTVSPDGQEIYWARLNGSTGARLMVTRISNGGWTSPQPVSFAGIPSGQFDDDAPVVSPDNRKLFFNSLRPVGSSTQVRWRFWYAERAATGWGEARPLPDVINSTGGIHWQASVSNTGTFYFGVVSGASVAIYYSRFVDGVYTPPEPLSVINTLGDVTCPFIAPDESYILFNKVEGGGASISYHISFKGNAGEWLPPQQAVGFPTNRESSFVTRDGKYVFCKSYWASAEIIEELRPSGS